MHGYRIAADGSAVALAADFVPDAGDDGEAGWHWLHFNLADARAVAWLAAMPSLSGAAQAFLCARHEHQQLQAAPGYVLGAIADLERGIEQSLDRVGFLHFALGERLVVSGRRLPLQSVSRLRAAIDDGRRIAGPAALVDALVEGIADGVEELVADLVAEIDRIEDMVLGEDTADERRALGTLRRTGVRVHRRLASLLGLLQRFERSGQDGGRQSLRLSLSALVQRLHALDHEVVAVQDRARLLQEEIAAKLAEESNRHLHTLSIITALFLPPTLIFGLFGMNTHDLPLAETPLGTFWAVAIGLAAAIAVYWWLRRWRGIG